MQQERKYPIKWGYKSHSYQIGDTGDYDGYWEVTNGNDSLITKEDYEDIEKDLQAVVDLLNNTYANFTFDRGNEAALEAENRWLKSELEQRKAQPGSPIWVKCSDRLPGHKQRVKWRDGDNPAHVTDGEISLFEIDKPYLDGWEWYDETGQSNKDDAVEFATFLNYVMENYDWQPGGQCWIDKATGRKPYNNNQLYEQYNQQKEGKPNERD